MENISFWCVYLLLSSRDKRKYIGSTNDIERRLREHNHGLVKSTKYRRPFELLGYRQCSNEGQARSMEYKFKNSHDSLLRLIKRGDFYLTNYGLEYFNIKKV